MQQVIVGKTYQQGWGKGTAWLKTNIEAQNPKRITMEEACEEMAKYWNCTPENARESLLKHGYASSPNRDWRMAGRGFDEGDVW